jgi:hypothetical protein
VGGLDGRERHLAVRERPAVAPRVVKALARVAADDHDAVLAQSTLHAPPRGGRG